MATSNFTQAAAAAAPDVAALQRLMKRECYWADIYSGTISDLIEAGLVLPSQVPGHPGNRKLQATYLADGSLAPKGFHGGTYALRVSLRGRGCAEAVVPVDGAEKDRRSRAAAHRRPRDAQVSAEQSVPSTPDEIARQQQAAVKCWRQTIDMAWVMASQGKDCRLAERDQQRFLEALCAAHAILNTATIINVEQQHAALGVARGDQTFQQFMLDQGLRGHTAQARPS